MKRKIWEMRWDSFTPVQDDTIPLILNTNKDVVISSGTASGKTEAAFLPILSMIEGEASDKLKVLYISPLKALINNQFERIIELCENIDIKIHRWHGDVSQSQKNKFIKKPTGILQITPESIESLFINRTEQLGHIFKDIEFVIIDEIHSFIDSNRGMHLRSLLSRAEGYTLNNPRIIGLSATIDNFDVVKSWVNHNHPEQVEIVESKGYDKKLKYSLMHFGAGEDYKKTLELFLDIRELTKTQKALIFCNSRTDVEELTYYLNRLSERDGMEKIYLAHHSSIDKKEREYVEKMMTETRTPMSIIATSTLELGIDIGDVDIVIQLDNTFSVSSLKQRLGRSGRMRDSNQVLQLYTTSKESLLQSLAVMELNLDGWVEPATEYKKPYDIAFHQIISICTETNGIVFNDLISKLFNLECFHSLEKARVEHLVKHMIGEDILEKVKGTEEIIVGLEGERILRSREFYAVFKTVEEYKVLYKAQKIGMLDKGVMHSPGDNIILTGRLWTITEIDDEVDKIYVTPAVHANPPRYFGGGAKIHPRIGEKVMEILCSDEEFSYAGSNAQFLLTDERRMYEQAKLTKNDRPLWVMNDEVIFQTFTGTIITQTLCWMIQSMDIRIKRTEGIGDIVIADVGNVYERIKQILSINWTVEKLIKVTHESNMFISKFSPYLPQDLSLDMHAAHEIDISGALSYLKKINLRVIYLQ